RSSLRHERLAQRSEDGMLGDLDLVLREQCPAVGEEEIDIGEVDVPLDANARLEYRHVVVVAVADEDERGSRGGVDSVRQRQLWPAAVLDLSRMHGVGRRRDVEEDALVLVAKLRRVLPTQLRSQ